VKQIKFKEIEDFCDDPALPGEVTAILHPERTMGYRLTLKSCGDELSVMSGTDRPTYFASVEAAMAGLVDVPNLSRQITIDLSSMRCNEF